MPKIALDGACEGLDHGGTRALVRIEDDGVAVWALQEPRRIGAVMNARMEQAALSSDGRIVAAVVNPTPDGVVFDGLTPGDLRLYHVDSQMREQRFRGAINLNPEYELGLHRHIVVTSRYDEGRGDNHTVVWNVRTGQPLTTLPSQSHWDQDLAFNADEGLLARINEEGEISILHTDTWKPRVRMASRTGRFLTPAFSPDSTELRVLHDDSTLRAWDTRSGGLRWALDIASGQTITVDDTHDRLLIGDPTGTLSIRRVGTKLAATLHADVLAAQSGAGRYAAVTTNTVELWRGAREAALASIPRPSGQALDLAVAADAPTAVALFATGEALVIRSGGTTTSLLVGTSACRAFLDRSGDHAVIAHAGRTELWQLRPPRAVLSVVVEGANCNSMASWDVLADGRILTDRWQRFIDVASGEEMDLFHNNAWWHQHAVHAYVGPDGRHRLAVLDHDDVRILELNTGTVESTTHFPEFVRTRRPGLSPRTVQPARMLLDWQDRAPALLSFEEEPTTVDLTRDADEFHSVVWSADRTRLVVPDRTERVG